MPKGSKKGLPPACAWLVALFRLLYSRQTDGHILLPRQRHPEAAGEHAQVGDCHLPGVDDLHPPGNALFLMEVAEAGPAKAVVVDFVLPLVGGGIGDCHHLVKNAVALPQAQAGGLAQYLVEELDAGRALTVELSPVAPPQDVVFLVDKGLPVARVAAPHGGLPEPAGELLAGDVAPAHVDVALVGDFVPHHGLAVAGAVVCGVLHMAVQVLALHGAVGHPRPGVVVEGDAVVHGAQVVVGVQLAEKAGVVLPVFTFFLLFNFFIFIFYF